MKKLDAEIDEKPTKAKVRELAELRIRNLQAFAELQRFNDTGKFEHEHPLVKHYSLQVQLEELLRKNPGEFLDEYGNTRENVKRYRSYCNNAKRRKDPGLHKKDKLNLKKHQDKLAMMEQILEENRG
jgi:hypothetical protein